jgi:hypothetical protein
VVIHEIKFDGYRCGRSNVRSATKPKLWRSSTLWMKRRGLVDAIVRDRQGRAFSYQLAGGISSLFCLLHSGFERVEGMIGRYATLADVPVGANSFSRR